MSSLVQTQSGKVEGEQRGAHHAFLGIPYAKPPLGRLRFQAPEPPLPWTGTRACKAYGASAIQGAMFAPGVLAEGPQAEDCLFVNVFTPGADQKKRPVLFWVHGGAFTVGSSGMPLYDGGRLAEQHDVVVVTFNYRLGALGYLAFGKDGERWGAADNRGQLDQLAALAWTRENIAGFGGDPDNITIFGESAGGAAVCLLLATPSARGLFRRAIVQSGTGPLVLPTADAYAPARAAFARELGIDERAPERLADVPVEAFQAAQAKFEATTPFAFYPVLDGALYPAQPSELIRSGQASNVPLIMGTNRDEWNLFAVMSIADFGAPMTEDELVSQVLLRFPQPDEAKAKALVATYRASRSARSLPHDNRALLRAIDSDRYFRMPSVRFMEAYGARTKEAFMYLFTQPSPAIGGMLGACHALELAFVFETYLAPGQESFCGTGDAVARLSRTISTLWTSFARGNAPEAPGIAWPKYDTSRRATLELSAEPRLSDDPFGDERRAWDGIL
jgi:para-nitrobenzyl esterase